MANREDGFYWVLLNDKWQVAEYCDVYWFIAGTDDVFTDDSDFQEIGDRVFREPKIKSYDMKCSCGRTLHQHTYCQVCDNDE
jgi:hypothetical protein